MIKLCLGIFSAKWIVKHSVSWEWKTYSPNGRVIDDLRSPNTFDTRLGERASANVQPWNIKRWQDFFSSWNNFTARPHTKEPVENELSDILGSLSWLTVIWSQKKWRYNAVQSILLLSKDV